MPDTVVFSEVKRLFDYDPITGVLLHKERTPDLFTNGKYDPERKCQQWNSQYAGKIVGSDDGQGYLKTRVFGKNIRVHRIAMAFILKSDFSGFVDHVNGNRSDNRAENLRISSPTQNARNQKRHRDNIAGVVWYKKTNKWRAQIWHKGKNKCLGYFESMEEAKKHREEAEKLYWSDR